MHTRGSCALSRRKGEGTRGGACGAGRGYADTRSPPIALLLQGDGSRMVRAPSASAWPPVRTLPRRGCEHDPVCHPACTTPARPTFRMPPCTRHPACGTARAWHLKGGAHRGRACGTPRRVVLTRNGGGAPKGSGAPLVLPSGCAQPH